MARRLAPRFLVVLLVSACASGDDPAGLEPDVAAALAQLPGAEVAAARAGVPTFLTGDLGRAGGRVDADGARVALPRLIAAIAPVFRLAPTDLRYLGARVDAGGRLHARFQQTQYGLDVEGGELSVHLDRNGVVYAVSGAALGGRAPSMRVAFDSARATAVLAASRSRGLSLGAPRLALILDGARRMRLTWEIEASGQREGEPVLERVFVDARTGAVALVLSEVMSARTRTVSTVSNGQVLPGATRATEDGPRADDSTVRSVFEHLGTTYDCYRQLFERDSYDDKGGALGGFVHYGFNVRNAYYNGRGNMVFGDGDGRNSGPFGGDLDIVAHELTHGVTRETANLRYQDESGAINEGMSDVFGAVCETYGRAWQITPDTWKIGEGSTTPSVPGDALRYMDNPTADGISTDWYPERYSGVRDSGGVHFNSGITNLAFKLLVTGGRHPRGKSDVEVGGIGLEKASRVFYRALTTYLRPMSQYADLRAATLLAAADLYGDAEREEVARAWSAVGVGEPGSLAPPPGPVTALLAPSVLAGKAGEERLYAVEVAPGTRLLTVETRGGTGDVDLYVERGAGPTLYASDASANLGSTEERVLIADPEPGTWYVLVLASTDHADVTLRARAGEVETPALAEGRTVSLGGDAKASREATFEVPPGAAGLTVELVGEDGDADLYLRRGGPASVATHDAAAATEGSVETLSVSAAPGVYHLLIVPREGQTGFGRATLRASFPPSMPLAAGQEIEVAAGAGQAQLFVVELESGAAQLEIAMTGGTGDADVFVRPGAPPTDRLWQWASYNAANEERVLVAGAPAGVYHVAVYAASAFAGARLVARAHDVAPVSSPLLIGHAVSLSFGPDDPQRFVLQVPPTAVDGTFSASGDGVQLYLRRGEPPTVDSYEHTGRSIALAPLAAGDWHALVVASKPTSGRMNAAVNATPAMRDGRALLLAGTAGSRKVLRFEAPADARGARFTLAGGEGDADLYVRRGAPPTVDEHDGKSERPGNDDDVTVDLGGGTYYVLVVAAADHGLAGLTARTQR